MHDERARNPFRVAEDTALSDNITKGRLSVSPATISRAGPNVFGQHVGVEATLPPQGYTG